MDIINKIWPEWSVEELLGTGSFGKVYKVCREKMGYVSYAAVKVIQIPQEISEVRNLMTSGMDHSSIHTYYKDLVKNLMSEIKVMESLKTADSIVAIEDYEVVEKSDGFGWTILIRMELLQNLSSYLEHHAMAEKDVVQLGIDICSALESCEKRHIIHRDVKVDNVFINAFGTYKLGDFGIARQLEKTVSAMSQKGTNMYMAPEIYRGEVYGNTVDIYSLGIMLYRLLNKGRFPFMPSVPQPLRYDDTEKAMQKRLSGETVPEIAGVNKKLFQIIQKACAFNASERFNSAAEMKKELNLLVNDTMSDFAESTSNDVIKEDAYKEERTVAAFGQDAFQARNMKSKKPDKIRMWKIICAKWWSRCMFAFLVSAVVYYLAVGLYMMIRDLEKTGEQEDIYITGNITEDSVNGQERSADSDIWIQSYKVIGQGNDWILDYDGGCLVCNDMRFQLVMHPGDYVVLLQAKNEQGNGLISYTKINVPEGSNYDVGTICAEWNLFPTQ